MEQNEKPHRWWRESVGGLWDKIGKLQFDFLVKNGLKPNHFLLDVGCGSLRGGIHFIRFLERGHYFGIDKNQGLLDGGKIELKENGLEHKNPILKKLENFGFLSLGQKFEYAIAQSVFTHLPLNDIRNCIMNIEHILTNNGEFYATFFESSLENAEKQIIHNCIDGKIISFPNKDPFHYPFSTFVKLCQDTTLEVQYIGEWNHPRDQKMLVFKKA